MDSVSSPKRRLLTKSRFKLASECPTKLAYTGKATYGNRKENDPFLRALAEGGFQVGALSKLYFPDGSEIETLDFDRSTRLTTELLERDEATIFEAALACENLFVRVDILRKVGQEIELYEVKAKSFDSQADRFFQRSKIRKLVSEWEPYLFDIAFQTYVAKKALPGFNITPFLYLINKRAECSVDGLNQQFLLKRLPNGHPKVEVKGSLTRSELGTELLIKIPVQDEVQFIFDCKHDGKAFSEWIDHLATHYVRDARIDTPVGSQCKKCEFRIGRSEKEKGLKSGFDECWSKLMAKETEIPLVLDLWDNRSTERYLKSNKFLLTSISKDDIGPEPRADAPGLSRTERQWIQVQKAAEGDGRAYLDREGIATEIKKWTYPLHFIDFETTQVAIPFNKGRRPYEPLAFQFSHHIVYEDGRIEHAGEYINRDRGKFPNFDFVRNLKKHLDADGGTIFRYAAHENTILCRIHEQLSSSGLPKNEVDELQRWIRSITKKKEKDQVIWEGPRNMVDMRDLVLRFYYHPLTQGSNSLKYVLPATLAESSILQERYSKPIYGAENGIRSANFRNKQWIHRREDGSVVDPYETLEPIFSPEEDRIIEAMYPETDIADGGAAMMAYARMQFTDMTDSETDRISRALLRYCELDTFAMVLLFEYWMIETEAIAKKSAAFG